MKLVKCKSCGRERPEFAISKKDCDKCRYEDLRKKPTDKGIKRNDIIGKGRKLLEASDYRINKYTLEEPDPVKLEAWRTWRNKVKEKMKTCKDGDSMVFPEQPK